MNNTGHSLCCSFPPAGVAIVLCCQISSPKMCAASELPRCEALADHLHGCWSSLIDKRVNARKFCVHSGVLA